MQGVFSVDKNGVIVHPGQVHTKQTGWTDLGSISAVEAALAVDERTVTAIEALDATKVVIWDLRGLGINVVMFRFRQENTDGDGEDDAYTLEMYIGRKDDEHLRRHATLTLTVGTNNADGTKHFIDTIVPSNIASIKDWSVIDSGNDRICLYVGDLCGADYVAFIASAMEGATAEALHIDVSDF